MNQMEHNYKIKDYKRYEAPGPFVQTCYKLNYPQQSYPNSQETGRMEERFQKIQWPRNKTLVGLTDQGDRMRFTRNQQISVVTNQSDHIIKPNLKIKMISKKHFRRQTERRELWIVKISHVRLKT